MNTELQIIIDIATMLIMAAACMAVVAWFRRRGGRIE